ncbi:hypothetical protein CC78DRAFT_507608 [Lojkania enalia]|uniref:Mid2 domain-containing protein n=1 Tax=Lojkania enalia TaxID=147567 RepID=A0A9P4NBJ5_9PLEO|nr:hypothetical protein CC78DRAFT_507608 [Didymosphaeria enalia]
MAMSRFFFAVVLATAVSRAAASPSPLDHTLRTVNAPGRSALDTRRAIGRELAAVAIMKRDEILADKDVTLDRSWKDTTLLTLEKEKEVAQPTNASSVSINAGIEITCKECYVKGVAKAQLSIEGDFNASQAINQTIEEVNGEVTNFTEQVSDYISDYFTGVFENLQDGLDLDDFDFPTMNFTFDLDVPSIPESVLKFQFDGLELYMDLDTTFSVGTTYEINLYSSNTLAGISVSDSLRLGVVFTIDLILSAEAELTMNSGFHIKLDDGVTIEIPLFSDNVTNLEFNGGQFEFLPVTIDSAGVTLSAVLRVGVSAGLTIDSPKEVFGKSISGGIEVALFAHVAEFTTNITAAPEEECRLQVIQEYQLALGAGAGVYIAVDAETWGPVAETATPIWYTTMADVCAIEGKPTPMPTSATVTARDIAGRQEELSTTSTEIEVKYTGVACESSLAICPASLQTTIKTTVTKTLVTAVPSGTEVTWPTSPGITDAVATTSAFGSNAKQIETASGTPTSYEPPPPPPSEIPTGSIEKVLEGETGGVSNKVIIGVSVGVGVPVIMALVAGFIFIRRRRRYSAVPRAEQTPMFQDPSYHGAQEPFKDAPAKKPGVNVSVSAH